MFSLGNRRKSRLSQCHGQGFTRTARRRPDLQLPLAEIWESILVFSFFCLFFFFFFWFCLHLPTGGPIGCVDSQRVGYGTESTDFSFLELLAVPRLTTQHVQFMDAW